VTGGSLEESKEALAISETDGLAIVIFLSIHVAFAYLLEGFLVFVYLKVCCLSQEGFFVRLESTQQGVRLITILEVWLLVVISSVLNLSINCDFVGVLEMFQFLTVLFFFPFSFNLFRSLKRVGIQKSIFRLSCHWPKRECKKERYAFIGLPHRTMIRHHRFENMWNINIIRS